MITVEVKCSNGNHWITGINGTLANARAYFIGNAFTRENYNGIETTDRPVSVELIGEKA